MATAEEISIVITALDQAKAILDGTAKSVDGVSAAAKTADKSVAGMAKSTTLAETEMGKMAKAAGINMGQLGGLSLAAVGVAAGVGAMAVGLISATKAAMEEEAGITRLNATLQAAGTSYQEYGTEIDAAIVAGTEMAFTDDQVRDSLGRLVQQTQDVNTALDLQTTAMDLARGTGMDLMSATELLGRVSEGNVSILRRYGIVLDENTSSTEALDEVSRRFAGQSEAYAETAAGAWEQLNVKLSDMTEVIGAGLLPAATELATVLADVAVDLDQSGALDATSSALTTAATAVVGYYGVVVDLTEIALTPALIATGALNDAIGGVAGVADPAGVAMGAVGDAASSAAGFIGDMAEATRYLRDAEGAAQSALTEFASGMTQIAQTTDDATIAEVDQEAAIAAVEEESRRLISTHSTLVGTTGGVTGATIASAEAMDEAAAAGQRLADSIDETEDAFGRMVQDTAGEAEILQAVYDADVDAYTDAQDEKARAEQKQAQDTAREVERLADEKAAAEKKAAADSAAAWEAAREAEAEAAEAAYQARYADEIAANEAYADYNADKGGTGGTVPTYSPGTSPTGDENPDMPGYQIGITDDTGQIVDWETIPGFAAGGTVPGMPGGPPTLAMVHPGETITPAGQPSMMGGGVQVGSISITIQGSVDSDARQAAVKDDVSAAFYESWQRTLRQGGSFPAGVRRS